MGKLKAPAFTTSEIEILLANFFEYRRNLVVPNISWGMGLHECDLLVLSQKGYLTEIEIKISKADLIRDKLKDHGHRSTLLRRLYFAIPIKLMPFIEHVPERAGIIVVEKYMSSTGLWRPTAHIKRAATINVSAPKATPEQRFNMARLGALRIWSLKSAIANYENERKSHTQPHTQEQSHDTQTVDEAARI
jgi:hypothetical protein